MSPFVTPPDFESAPDLPTLHRMLEAVQMRNGWSKAKPSLYPEPEQSFVPARWRYTDARAALHAAGRLVGTEWAERRNLILANPIEGNSYPTVTTLVAAYQMVRGGETARSHRHTPNAMRIVIEAAAQTFTLVDGVNVPMAAGDVLLTPCWAYHGHDNRSDHDAYWIDILDAPLVQLLGPMFFEHHPAAFEPAAEVASDSALRFAYRDYRPRLAAAAEIADGVRALTLGPPTLPSFDRVALQLRAGACWRNARTTANQIYVVVEGRGESRIGATQFDWAPGDVIAAPSWRDQFHRAAADAVLVRMSDAPLLRGLNWLRERPDDSDRTARDAKPLSPNRP